MEGRAGSGGSPGTTYVEISELASDSAAVIEQAMGADRDRVAMRMQRGCRCFVAQLGPEIAGYAWLSTTSEWIGELELEIRPASNEAYLWNCVTLPAHRRRGVFSALLASVRAQLAEEGLARLWIGSVEHSAEKAVSGAGFAPVLRFEATWRWGFRCLKVRPAFGPDLDMKVAAPQLAGQGLPVGSGFHLRRSERRKH